MQTCPLGRGFPHDWHFHVGLAVTRLIMLGQSSVQAAHAHVNRYFRLSQACLSAFELCMGFGPYVVVTCL